jgi:hypothetical protein
MVASWAWLAGGGAAASGHQRQVAGGWVGNGDPGVESRSTSVGVGPSTVVEALFWWLSFWLVSDPRCDIASDRPPRHRGGAGRPMSGAFLPPSPAWSSCSAVACGPAVADRQRSAGHSLSSARRADWSQPAGYRYRPPRMLSLCQSSDSACM